jgi:predicted 3-demethylubiquinone-9 3-methyltransferase (glyoxalase superfamily)
MNTPQKIIPHLWFDTQAKEAAEFYCSVFPNSFITSAAVLHNTPSGDCDVMSFNLSGHDFMAISGGPLFTINQSISFILNFDPSQNDQAKEDLQTMWERLAEGGKVLMGLQEYPFSKLYGWVQDRFGIGWQLMLTNPEGESRPFITPSLMFAGSNTNKAEEAIQFYVSVFKNTKQGTLARYPEDTGPARKDFLMYADFMLENQWLAAMDSGVEQPFIFNEAISLLINCGTQEEIDYYWGKLSAVPEAEQCGWLKDKFGVSWQVSPTTLNGMLTKGTSEQIDRVTEAFMGMKKFDIAKLEEAYHDSSNAR